MKLKHVIIFYPSMERGGVTINLKHLMQYFSHQGIKVSLISNNINKKKLNINKKNFLFSKISSKSTNLFIPDRWQKAIVSIKHLIKCFSKYKKNQTVVLSMQSSMVSIIVCKFFGVKIVARNSEDPIYSTIYADNYLLSIFVFFMRFFIYNFANGILTNSYGSKKSLELFILNKSKIKVLYNPYLLKIKRNSNVKKKDTILSVGRLCKQKDFFTLIKGFSQFLKKYSSYKMIILGDGPDKDKLNNLIQTLDIKDKVFIKGWVQNTDKYFSSAKIFALTSLYEGLGNVYIDAVNNEIPCVYTDCRSGPNEILLNNKGGFPVKVKDPEHLNYQLEKCILNYRKSKKMINFAKKKINRFYYREVCPKYLDYLKQISAN